MEITIADCAADDSCGGGLWADRANVTLRGGSRIERCTAGGDGGGILAYDNSKVALLEGSVLSSCHAGPAAFGGGLHLRHGFTSAYSAPDTPPHAWPPFSGPMPACLPSAFLPTQFRTRFNRRHLADSQGWITQSSIINCSGGYCGGAFGVFGGLWADPMASSSLLATNSVRMLQLK